MNDQGSKNRLRVDVPVKIVASSRPVEPVPAPVEQSPIVVAPKINKVKPKKVTAPLTMRPEHERRRLMWLMVAGTMVLIVVGWVALLGREMSAPRGTGVETVWTKVKDLLSSVKLTPQSSSAAEKEIRQLDQQVFPELSN